MTRRSDAANLLRVLIGFLVGLAVGIVIRGGNLLIVGWLLSLTALGLITAVGIRFAFPDLFHHPRNDHHD